MKHKARKKNKYITAKNILIIALFLLIFLFSASWPLRYVSVSILGILLLSFLRSRSVYRNIRVYKDEDVLRGQRNEKIRVRLYIENRSFFSTPPLTIRDWIGSLHSESLGSAMLVLKAKEQRVVSYDVVSYTRGEFRTGPVTVGAKSPLGFFEWEKRFDVYKRIIIYPNVYPLELLNNQGLPVGSLQASSKIYEDLTQFRSIREYVSGDEMKRINWKVSARMGKLFSMDFQPTLYFPVIIFLNLSADDYPMKYRDSLVERCCETAASLIFYFVNLKMEVGLLTTGERSEGQEEPSLEVKAGYGHALNLLETISCSSLSPGHADMRQALFMSGMKLPVRSRVLIISPPLPEDQAQVILSAKRNSYNLEFFEISDPNTMQVEDHLSGSISTHKVKRQGEKILND